MKWGACLGAVDDGLAVLNAAGDANCCRPCGALAGRLRPWQLGNEMGRPMGSVRCIPREARKEAGRRVEAEELGGAGEEPALFPRTKG